MSHRAPLFIRLALCVVLISQSTAASAQAVVARVVASPGVQVAPAGIGLARPVGLGAAPQASLPTASLLPTVSLPGLAAPSVAAAQAVRAHAAAALPAALAAPAARAAAPL
ncbi:MAG: hypothetical protein HY928_17600, partial [Elusimicrobia bacterium]|nr:hypothetical protein [Elusimicrobiota bacterium]